jgi:NAD(P)H-dependent FMN reductase
LTATRRNDRFEGTLNFVVLYGSVRRERQGIKFARFLETQLEKRGHTSKLIDPVEYDLPLLDKMYKEYSKGAAPERLEAIAGLIRQADGFLVVSGEYNHSIPPALTNMLDHFLEEWFWRPSAIACYSAGDFGGVRAAIQLRATLAELGMPSISSIFPMPRVQDQFDEDGTPRDPVHERRVGRFLDEFEWYAVALKEARAKGVPY